MTGYYSRWIDQAAELKLPLLKLLRKEISWHWGLEQEQSFRALKNALMNPPVLARPNFSLPFRLQTDASDFAISAVLTQIFPDEENERNLQITYNLGEENDIIPGEHPISFASRVLTEAERKYSTTERECLAVKWGTEKHRGYLEGYSFDVITDHESLKWLFALKNPKGRLGRWVLELQSWAMNIVPRKGKRHQVPDVLSRYQESFLGAMGDSSDEWYNQRFQEVTKDPDRFADWRKERGQLYIHRRERLLDPFSVEESCWKLVVPQERRKQVLEEAHCQLSSGHFGIDKTYDRIAREYYWPGMWVDTTKFVKECVQCQIHKSTQTGPVGLMGRRIIERPWVVVSADCMEFPPSHKRFTHLLVFQDLFTKWVELIPLRSANGKSITRALEDLVLLRWEIPHYLVVDNGSEFDNQMLRTTCTEYGIKIVPTPPYHPQANPTERANRTLKTMIRMYVGEDRQNWDKHIPELRHAINTAIQSSTKVSPAFLNYGRHPPLPRNLRHELEVSDDALVEMSDPEVWSAHMDKLKYLHDFVIRNLFEAQSAQKKAYDEGRRDITCRIGDWVLRETKTLSNKAKRYSAKLAPKWEGPYRVVKVLSPVVYEIETPEGSRIPKVSVSQLKPYVREPPSDESRTEITGVETPAQSAPGKRGRGRPKKVQNDV